jgi:hypothetical protein
VTTADDNGNNTNPVNGSLRSAILTANAGDTIRFNINNAAVQVLVSKNALPTIGKLIFIDGRPPDDKSKPLQTIELTPDPNNNPMGASGLTLGAGADGSKVFGLTIDRFDNAGVRLIDVSTVQLGRADDADITNGQGELIINRNKGFGLDLEGNSANNSVVASIIGTDPASTPNIGNAMGIFLAGGSGNQIGPGSVGSGKVSDGLNVISGNVGAGVYILADGNFISGNFIGTNVAGTAARANGSEGVKTLANNTTIGALVGGPGLVKGKIVIPANVISGNSSAGISLAGGQGQKIYGNFIGTDKTGAVALANATGVFVDMTTNSLIGGAQPGLGNVISGNTGTGVVIGLQVPNHIAQQITVQQNWIGVGNDGVTKLPNGAWGVQFRGDGATNNTVKGNVIANNPSGAVQQGKGNKTFDPNSISGDGYGIYTDGTNTDAPVITSAVVSGNSITITGTLARTPNSAFILEFCGNQNAAVPGYEQGEVFLGSITVTTDANGNASFTATFNAVYGSYVSATATGMAPDGYTSAFSAYAPITGESTLAAVGGVVWNDTNANGLHDSGEQGVAGVVVQLFDANNNLIASLTTDANGNYLFTGLTPGQYYVQFTPPANSTFTQPYQGDATVDSHADRTTGQTEAFTLIAGQIDPFFSAGLLFGG